MTFTPIAKGTPNWDVPLNTALTQLDNNTTTVSGNTLQRANNLSDLTNVPQARSNLGLSGGSAAGVNQFNVKDYGALGNGVANDNSAIQSAITAANTNGGIVYFPPGQYLVNSGTGFTLSGTGVNIMGSGIENTKIIMGASYTGTDFFSVTGNGGVIRDISIQGANTTTTSNPASHGVTATGVQSFKVFNTVFLNINGYAVRAIGTASQTLHGGMVYNTKIQSCAGGVYILSDNTNTAANFLLSNIFTRFLGVTSGANANLDGFHIEDSWDVLAQNCFAWMNATTGGTGVAFRVKGNCAATFIMNLDALGPQTGASNVSIEAGPNGSPQNVQITGGVIQQGNVGLTVSGAATQVRVASVRFINNQTHGAVISTTGPAIYLDSVFFSGNGAGATGTNYDLNWSGTTTGFVTNCRFASNIVAVSSAGVQQSVNIAAGQNVRFFNADFQGTGNAIANWFTNLPAYATTNDAVVSGDTTNRFAFLTDVNFSYTTGPGRVSIQPNAAGNNCLSLNVQGTDANDRFRLTGDGKISIGPGTTTRDTSWGRQGSAQIGTADSDIFVNLAGKTLIVKSGTNAKAGTTSAMVAGSVTVSTTAITTNSVVIASLKTAGGTVGAPFVGTITPGTSFVLKSTSGTDTSVYNWIILETA